MGAANSSTRAYRYLFTRAPKLFNAVSCLGATHTAELLLLFAGSFPDQAHGMIVGDELELKLSADMIESWTRFVITGSPGPQWQPTDATEPLLLLDGTNTS